MSYYPLIVYGDLKSVLTILQMLSQFEVRDISCLFIISRKQF